MSNNGLTNNLKSIKNNYANMSSSDDDDDNNNNKTDTDKNASNPTSSSNYKILTPFVPYKNPFVVDEEEEELEDNSDVLNDEFLLSERDSKRQKSEFNSNSKLSSQSSITKVYRTKVSPPSNNSNKSDSTSDDNDDSDVDLSSVTINPKLLENDGMVGTSSKRKRQDSHPHLDEETSNASTFMSDDLSMESDNEPLLLRKPSSETTKLSSIEEAPELLVAETSLDTKSNQYWRSACTPSICFGLNDIINREFGYSSRPGHGTRCSLNLFSPNVTEATCHRRRLIYDNQLQTPRHFIRKAMSGLSYVRKMRLTQNLSFHEGCVNSLNFNRLGTMLASGSDDFQVCLWDWAKNCLVLNFDSGHKSNVFQTKFIPFTGDSQIATCARDGQVRLALISSSGAHIGTKKLAKHSDSCHKLSIEYDSCNLFLSCGEDGVVFEIDLRQTQPAKILNVKHVDSNNKLPLYSISSNPSNTYQFVVSGKDQYLRVYDKRMLVNERSKILKIFCPKKLKDSRRASITSAVYSNDGSDIIASYSDDDIYLFNSSQDDDTDAKYVYKGHRNSETVKGVNFYGANSEYIVSGSDCGQIFFWEKTSQQIVNVLKGDEHGIVNVLEPHPNFPFLATSGLDSDVKIWSPTCDEVNPLENLNDIVKDNQQFRENNRHFSLSSFEFELLLLLMHRPNNRVFFRSRGTENSDDIANNTNNSNTLSENLSSMSSRNLEEILSRPFPFARRSAFAEDNDEEDDDEDDDDDDDEEEEDDEDDEDDDEDEEVNDHDFDIDGAFVYNVANFTTSQTNDPVSDIEITSRGSSSNIPSFRTLEDNSNNDQSSSHSEHTLIEDPYRSSNQNENS